MITLPQAAIDELPNCHYAKGTKFVIIDADDKSEHDWEAAGRPVIILPVVQYRDYIGCIDIAYGHDMLWDGCKWHISKQGVFLNDIIFVSDFYGYTDGAIFVRQDQ